MNDHEPVRPTNTRPARLGSTATPGSSADASASVTVGRAGRPAIRRRTSTWCGRVVATAVACAAIGLCAACGASSSATSASATAGVHGPGSGGAAGSNARSGPAAGGSWGRVDSVSASGFTLSTAAGQKVTVNEASSTAYQMGTSSAGSNSVTSGESVLVLGTSTGTTITATKVIVEPAGIGGSPAYSPSAVVSFQKGSPSTAEQDGQIPANYTEGSGTIVSGTAANKSTEAALAAYPGGVVDRVVKLSGGEYEVHYIGVNWPHHIFVNQDFAVVGAD
jgi:hypothetical protein